MHVCICNHKATVLFLPEWYYPVDTYSLLSIWYISGMILENRDIYRAQSIFMYELVLYAIFEISISAA